MKKGLCFVLIVCTLLATLPACGSSDSAGSTIETDITSADTMSQVISEDLPEEEQTAADESAERQEETGSKAEESVDTGSSEQETASYEYAGEWATYPLCDPGSVTLSMWCQFPGFLSMIGIDSYAECSVFDAAEQATGIHIEFTEASMANATELFSLMCASGDMKDILSGVSSYYSSTSKAIEEEVIVDLAEYAEQYMGNYMTILNDPMYTADHERAYNVEGQLAEVMSIADDYIPTQGMQIRKDWLDELQLSVPETYDELESVLTAFRDSYGCTSAMLLTGVTQMTNLVAGYGTAGAAVVNSESGAVNMYQIDGVVRNGYQDEGYREYLTMMNRWYTEGLLSRDFITMTTDNMENNTDGLIIGGEAGVWVASGDFIGQYEQQAQTTEPEFSVIGIADPYSKEYNPEGTTHFSQRGVAGGSNALSISTNCQDIGKACEWLDYFWSADGQLLCNYGIEGEGFYYDETGAPQFTDFIVNGANFQFMQTGYTLSAVPTLQDFDKSFFMYADNVLDAFDLWNSTRDDLYTMPSALTLNTEQSDAYTEMFSDIQTMAEERVGQFITGEKDIDQEWDQFQQDLISMGIEECVAIYQEAYDTYLAG